VPSLGASSSKHKICDLCRLTSEFVDTEQPKSGDTAVGTCVSIDSDKHGGWQFADHDDDR
jgi:hypothetical protein